jgi:hypothetical protein
MCGHVSCFVGNGGFLMIWAYWIIGTKKENRKGKSDYCSSAI